MQQCLSPGNCHFIHSPFTFGVIGAKLVFMELTLAYELDRKRQGVVLGVPYLRGMFVRWLEVGCVLVKRSLVRI